MEWIKKGRILTADKSSSWLTTYAGAAFALSEEKNNIIKIFVSGRDSMNRSRIGIVKYDLKKDNIVSIEKNACIELGEKGTFDQNGTAYPWVVKANNEIRLYYTGWIPGVLVPFMNDPGLAISQDCKNFERISRAPIMAKTDKEPFGVGSMCVIKLAENDWKMWYTSFDKWGQGKDDAKHYYTIKIATSKDGIVWKRLNKTCIEYQSGDYSIARPSVIFKNGKYHMWFSYRGESYRLGYATSLDGINWNRNDHLSGIDVSETGWDSEMICYSHVFENNGNVYMIYNGNDYGKSGLGLAKLKDELK